MTGKSPYNAAVLAHEELAPGLFLLRVRPDGPWCDFQPGQFAVLGLTGSAPRCAFADTEEDPAPPDRVIRRAYSIASSSQARQHLEFYIALVGSGALTPRLCALRAGDRLWLGPKASGFFTLDEVPEDRDVLLIATGTGLAPYMSMIRSLHRCGEGRRYVVVHGARYSWDLGYRAELEALDHGCGTFAYLPTVTRPEKDANWQGHAGRIQSVFEDGAFESQAGRAPDPARDHVFLCGNPEMVDAMQKDMEQRGFTVHDRTHAGSLHIERYW